MAQLTVANTSLQYEPVMRIGLVQINPLVGDIAGNTDKILAAIRRAGEAGADLAVFPELSIVGYPPKDFLLKRQFVRDKGMLHPVGIDAYARRRDEVPTTMERFEAEGTPQLAIVDREGDLRFSHLGRFDAEIVEAFIDRLLLEKRDVRVLGDREHPLLEIQQGQLPVEVLRVHDPPRFRRGFIVPAAQDPKVSSSAISFSSAPGTGRTRDGVPAIGVSGGDGHAAQGTGRGGGGQAVPHAAIAGTAAVPSRRIRTGRRRLWSTSRMMATQVAHSG